MPIPWLTALKVVPWSDVIEHAPKVLKSARDLLQQQRQRRSERAHTSAARQEVVDSGSATPDWPALENALSDARNDVIRLQQAQERLSQMLAEVAEQNAQLGAVAAVLRKRTHLLAGAVVIMAVALAVRWLW